MSTMTNPQIKMVLDKYPPTHTTKQTHHDYSQRQHSHINFTKMKMKKKIEKYKTGNQSLTCAVLQVALEF